MTIPKFSRVEIRHDDSSDLVRASRELRALSDELRILAIIPDEKMMRLAAHAAIRETSVKLRGA